MREKKSCRGIEQVRKAGRQKIKPFLLNNNPEKFSSSLSRQSSETKSNTELVSRKPLPYLEFNKLNKQNVSETNLFKNWTIPSLKITVDTLIDVKNNTWKHHP